MRVATVLLYITLSLSAFNAIAVEQVRARLEKNLQQVFPDIDISRVNSTPIDNIYEVMIGLDVIYMTGDARFVLKGDLIDMEGMHNLSEDLRASLRADLLNNIPENEYIEFASEDNKDAIYVFTDVDCSYCRKLHRDVAELNNNAITVRYLAYPGGGKRSPSHQKMVNVWCAEDRPKSLTEAKNGKSAEARNCENPVAKQHALGRRMGITGTPAIFLEDGRALPGYMSPDELLRTLGR